LFELLELRHDITVVGLIDQLRQEGFAHRQQLLRYRSGRLDERGVKTFEDVRVGLEREDQELPQFPMAFLRRFILDLLRRAIQRPLQICGRQIDSTAVGVGNVDRQTERARADDATVDHEVVKVELGENLFAGLRRRLLVLFADGYLVAMQRDFNAVDETHTVGMRAVIGRLDDFAHCAARAQYVAIRPFDLDTGHHLRAGGQNHMKLLRQLIGHDTLWISRERNMGNPLSGGLRQTSCLKWGTPDGCSILAMTNEKWQVAGWKRGNPMLGE